VAWFQKRLAAHGYTVPQTGEMDNETKNVLVAFQMKYRPMTIDGVPDAESAALLDVLTAPKATLTTLEGIEQCGCAT
jgi:N-acetylmuramoyl-L-alanine amidase